MRWERVGLESMERLEERKVSSMRCHDAILFLAQLAYAGVPFGLKRDERRKIQDKTEKSTQISPNIFPSTFPPIVLH